MSRRCFLSTLRLRLTLAISLGSMAAILTLASRTLAADTHPAQKAVAALDAGTGLVAQLFASEPMMLNPTNIDVDARGRVWVCEVVNYRHNNGRRKDGDRILILEDTNGDGAADKVTTFYQGRDIDSALGICVLGNKVIVACSPNVFVFTKDDADKVVKKELLFTKTGRVQHDHSAHTFTFGPDGRLYWNFGNEGHAVNDKNGQPVVDLDGQKVVDNGHPYYGGMVFRCEPDGSKFEVLGHNFRNNYEVAVDSFGTLWQSDNDDDGNRGVRINYVMEHGNYGYKDEMTGAQWPSARTNIEKDIPSRHWHQNDPGVVPNLLPTGAGSPCGIMVYEGSLLPSVFQNQMIHCDAGPNVVRAYPTTAAGAGYTARIENVLKGTRDNWFRPVDVCAAPDGSLIVADWYDPGVGGHRQGDEDHGRLFRVTTPAHEKYVIPKFDYSTPEGAVEALKNPCLSVRYLAWTALVEMGSKAQPALTKLWQDENPRLRARALWLLGRIPDHGQHYVDLAIADANPDLRITGLRLARQLELPLKPTLDKLVDDSSPAVRRECALALRHSKLPEAASLWARLALQHDGKDRWYLEALGIGADGQWDAFLEAEPFKSAATKLDQPGGMSRAAWRDIVWRSRGKQTPALLAEILRDHSTPTAELPRFMRAFDYLQGPEKTDALWDLALTQTPDEPARGALIALESIQRLGGANVKNDPKHAKALSGIVDRTRGTAKFVLLVDRFNLSDRHGDLLTLAQQNAQAQLGVDAVRVLLNKRENGRLASALAADTPAALATLTVLGTAADERANPLLLPIVGDTKRPLDFRRAAARALARNHAGGLALLKMAKDGQLDARLKDTVAVPLTTAIWPDVHKEAATVFPLPNAGNQKALPAIGALLKERGDAQRGRQVFTTRGTCINCHQVGTEGKQTGPNLTEIGDKLALPAMFESILYPSAGISVGYETYELTTAEGTVVIGLLADKTADTIRIKNVEGIVLSYPAKDAELRKLDTSLMPADLQKNMTQQDLVDLVEYLRTLKKAK